MACNNSNNQPKCGCEFNVKTVGVCDVSKINFDGTQRETLNWTEVSIPEMLCIPNLKPDIEHIDQVYANVVLNDTRLIETPFAYKYYVLASFYTAVEGLLTSLPGLLTTLTTAIDAITTAVNGIVNAALTTAINAAVTALQLIPGTEGLVTILNAVPTLITSLATGITTALNEVTTATNALITAIGTVPFSPTAICEAIGVLEIALNTLLTLVNSLVTSLQALVTEIDDLANDLGLDAATMLLIDAVTALINTAIGTLGPLVTTADTAITAILTPIAAINCQEASVIVLLPNAEGTCLSGRKLIVEGSINQKVVYTALVAEQSVHSAHYEIPFVAYIIPYANFENFEYQQNISVINPNNPTAPAITVNGYLGAAVQEIIPNLCEEFVVDTCIEDVFIYALDTRTMFKNVTLFLKARIANTCH